MRPCPFHSPLGNIREGDLSEILNSPEALRFRRQLDVSCDPVCRTCVGSLNLPAFGPFEQE